MPFGVFLSASDEMPREEQSAHQPCLTTGIRKREWTATVVDERDVCRHHGHREEEDNASSHAVMRKLAPYLLLGVEDLSAMLRLPV
jgi:hypothetical protein